MEFETHFEDFPIVVADELGVVDRFSSVAEALDAYPTAKEFQGSEDAGFTYWDQRKDATD